MPAQPACSLAEQPEPVDDKNPRDDGAREAGAINLRNTTNETGRIP